MRSMSTSDGGHPPGRPGAPVHVAPRARLRPGAAAAGLGLGVSELIAALLPGATSLVAAIGQAVIDRQPPGAKDFVVALFGTNDKLALEIVVVLAALAFGAGLGVLATRRFAAAALGFAAFGLLGFLAALGRPARQPGRRRARRRPCPSGSRCRRCRGCWRRPPCAAVDAGPRLARPPR